MPSLLFIDSQDSFSFNIIDSFYKLGVKNIKMISSTFYQTKEEWKSCCTDSKYSHIILGPGPGAPEEHPLIIDALREVINPTPILGICLGYQIIMTAFYAKIVPTGAPNHGIASAIVHTGKSRLFDSLPETFLVGRYHSLGGYRAQDPIRITATINTGIITDPPLIMAIEHQTLPIFGVQFHPESFLSEHGLTLLNNFCNILKK